MCSSQLIRPACLRLSASHPQHGPRKTSYDNLLLLSLVLFHLRQPMRPDVTLLVPTPFSCHRKTDQASNSMPDLPPLPALRRCNRGLVEIFTQTRVMKKGRLPQTLAARDYVRPGPHI